MKSKLCSGLLVLSIAVLSATAAHAADSGMRLVGKEAKVISGAGWAGGEPGLLRFNIRVRDLCSPVSSESASEPVPCSDWRRLLPQDVSSESLLLADGTSAATASEVTVFGVLAPAGSVEPRTVGLEFLDGLWVLSAAKVMASSADQLTSGSFSLSRIFWSGSAEASEEALFVVSGDQVKGMHRLVLSPSGTQAEPRPGASTVPGLVQALTEEDASAEISPSNSTPVILELPKSYRDQFQNTRDSWESVLGPVALIGGFSLAIPNSILFFHLNSSSSTNIFDAFGRELGMIFSGMLMGTGLTFAAIGGILIAIGHAKNKIQRSRLRDHQPDLRHSLARRRQVEWGMRFAFP